MLFPSGQKCIYMLDFPIVFIYLDWTEVFVIDIWCHGRGSSRIQGEIQKQRWTEKEKNERGVRQTGEEDSSLSLHLLISYGTDSLCGL